MAQIEESVSGGSCYHVVGDAVDDIPFIDDHPDEVSSPTPKQQHGTPLMNFAFIAESLASSCQNSPRVFPSPTQPQSNNMPVSVVGEEVPPHDTPSAAETATAGTDPAENESVGKSADRGFVGNGNGCSSESGITYKAKEDRKHCEKKSSGKKSPDLTSYTHRYIPRMNGPTSVQSTAVAAQSSEDAYLVTTKTSEQETVPRSRSTLTMKTPEVESAPRSWSTSSYPGAIHNTAAESADSVFDSVVHRRPDLAKSLTEKLIPDDRNGTTTATTAPPPTDRAANDADDKDTQKTRKVRAPRGNEKKTKRKSCPSPPSSGSENDLPELRIVEDGDRPSLSRQSSVQSNGSGKKKLSRRVSFNDNDFHERTKNAFNGALGNGDGPKNAFNGALGNGDGAKNAFDGKMGSSDRTKGASSGTSGSGDRTKGAFSGTSGSGDRTKGASIGTSGSGDRTKGASSGTSGSGDRTKNAFDGKLRNDDRTKGASSGSLGSGDRTKNASNGSLGKRDGRKHASSGELRNKRVAAKRRPEDTDGGHFGRAVSEIPLYIQNRESGLSEESATSNDGGVSPSYGRKSYSDTFLNETSRNGGRPTARQKARNGKAARRGALRQAISNASTVSEQSLEYDVLPVEEVGEEEERAGRDSTGIQSDSSYRRVPDVEGDNSPEIGTEDSEDDSSETDAESDSEKKGLPMFFVGTDTDPSRPNGYPSEAPLLSKHENGIAESHGNGGETNDVTLRHPPKSQNSALLGSLFMILSGLYGILVVVLGAVIPLTEIFVSGDRTVAFEYFYIYLYSTSIIFLCYVYVYLLRRKRLQTEFITRTLSRSVSFTRGFATSFLQRQNSDKSRQRKRMVSLDESNHHTGTFYLRLGVLGFGIGSMIHSGLNFGKFFGSITEGQCSSGPSLLLKPLLHLIFTFSQLYFIFMNSKMCIHRYKVVAHFGLMHMAATNICVWFRSIVVETLHEIHHLHAHQAQHAGDGDHHADELNHLTPGHHATDNHVAANTNGLGWVVDGLGASENRSAAASGVGRKLLAAMASAASAANGSHENPGGMMELRCSWNNMMGKAVDSAGPYLYPCTIEYSLMCAGILYVMWNNVGTRPRRRTNSEMQDEEEDLKHQRMSVDCTSSSRGLFLGIFLTVCAIISIIAFYVMVSQPQLRSQALLLTHLSETIIYCVTLFALVMATMKMRHLVFHSDHASDLEETLIIIAYTGLMAFNIFSLIAAILMAPAEGAALTIMSNFTMMLQSAFQTIFMLAGDRMSAGNSIQERKKPGREYVTFLLLCNFAMWIINTFETQKPEHNPLQVGFYGPDAWSIFSHISVPLGIYYRFHSTVCLSNIWKNAWKVRKHH